MVLPVEMRHMQPYLEEIWSWLHGHPETGLHLEQTADFVAKELRSLGYEVRENAGGSGIIAIWDTGRPGPSFGLRADMDALPFVVEGEKTSYHACGHDAHTAMLLTAAKALKEADAIQSGRLVLVFQAGEEIAAGALALLDSGKLPELDEIVAMHILFDAAQPVGWVTPDLSFSGTGILRAEFTGRSAHGSRPDLGINATEIAALAVQAVNSLHFNPAVPHSCKVTAFDATHVSNNTIPGRAIVHWDFRAQTNELLEVMKKELKTVISGIAAVFDAQVQFQEEGCPASSSSQTSVELVQQAAQANQISLLDRIVVTGGEDFNYFSKLLGIPSTCMGLAVGATPGIHVYGMKLDHSAMLVGAAMYAGCAVERLGGAAPQADG